MNSWSGHRFDLWSAVLCALMFGSLISGINGLGHGQAALALAGEFIAAAATGYLLVRRQAAQAMPLLPIDLFRRPIFSVSVTTLGAVLYRSRPRLRLAAVLFARRDRGVGGGHRAADDAVAGDQRADGAVCRPTR